MSNDINLRGRFVSLDDGDTPAGGYYILRWWTAISSGWKVNGVVSSSFDWHVSAETHWQFNTGTVPTCDVTSVEGICIQYPWVSLLFFPECDISIGGSWTLEVEHTSTGQRSYWTLSYDFPPLDNCVESTKDRAVCTEWLSDYSVQSSTDDTCVCYRNHECRDSFCPGYSECCLGGVPVEDSGDCVYYDGCGSCQIPTSSPSEIVQIATESPSLSPHSERAENWMTQSFLSWMLASIFLMIFLACVFLKFRWRKRHPIRAGEDRGGEPSSDEWLDEGCPVEVKKKGHSGIALASLDPVEWSQEGKIACPREEGEWEEYHWQLELSESKSVCRSHSHDLLSVKVEEQNPEVPEFEEQNPEAPEVKEQDVEVPNGRHHKLVVAAEDVDHGPSPKIVRRRAEPGDIEAVIGPRIRL